MKKGSREASNTIVSISNVEKKRATCKQSHQDGDFSLSLFFFFLLAYCSSFSLRLPTFFQQANIVRALTAVNFTCLRVFSCNATRPRAVFFFSFHATRCLVHAFSHCVLHGRTRFGTRLRDRAEFYSRIKVACDYAARRTSWGVPLSPSPPWNIKRELVTSNSLLLYK